MKNYKKSGQMGENIGAMINLLVGVGVAVLVLIFVGTLAGSTYQLQEADIEALGRTSVTGEVLSTVTKGTPQNLVNNLIYTDTFTLTNGTNLASVGAGNYTVTTSGVFNLTTATYNQSESLTAAYQYKDTTVSEHIKQGVISGFGALEQTGSYLPLIVIAFVISLVLLLVFGLASGKTGGGNTAL